MEILNAPGVLHTLSHEVDLAKQYILLHIDEAIDIDEVLLTSNLTMAELKQRFEAEIGCPPREFILHEKIKRAKSEVANSSKSVAEIAYQYHFSSVSFFRMRFKQETGMSVKQYRKRFMSKK